MEEEGEGEGEDYWRHNFLRPICEKEKYLQLKLINTEQVQERMNYQRFHLYFIFASQTNLKPAFMET